jgi:hypothetical protein
VVNENDNEYQFNMTIDPKVRKELTWAIEPWNLKKAKEPGSDGADLSTVSTGALKLDHL